MSRLTADTCKRPAFFVFGIYQPPYPCFLLSETRKAGRFFGATLYPVALRLQDNADFFGATLYPVQAFLLCIPDHFFGAFIQTPTLIFIIFLGNCPVSAQADRKPGEPVQALRYTTRGDRGRKVCPIRKTGKVINWPGYRITNRLKIGV